MRAHSLAVLTLVMLAPAVLALDVIELKNGRMYQVQSAKVMGDRLFIQLHPTRPNERIGFAVPRKEIP